MGRSQAVYTRQILTGIQAGSALPGQLNRVAGLLIFDDINPALTGDSRIPLLKASDFFQNFILFFHAPWSMKA